MFVRKRNRVISVVSNFLLFYMIFVSNAVAFDPHATKYELTKLNKLFIISNV
jgi:hypothetical protein